AAVYDLMQALERSLDASKGRGGGGSPKGKTAGGGAKPGEDLSELSKDDLYERAQELGVSGRSKMSRKELEQAVRKAS
ncbi:MAG TPA: Rho termination factor N-terminal domain-containing protein, partial [Acidimicrobiales bacterium]|nr:Rho termination factor N-terminal domain-containing protein [Acidimicrobiales bacterium]